MAKSRFAEIYGGAHRTVLSDSPELKFFTSVINGDLETAVCQFPQEKQFGGQPILDIPQRRYIGTAEIKGFAKEWSERFGPQSSGFVEAVIQTRTGGRSATELVLHFMQDGEEKVAPMALVAELRSDGKMDECHIYYNFHLIPGTNAYRPPIFPPKGDFDTRQEMLSGSIREYLVGLHDPSIPFWDKADKIFADQVVFGGYGERELDEHLRVKSRDEIRKDFEDINKTLTKYVFIRVETIIDDGKICCIEWEQLVTPAGRKEKNRLSEAGCSFYERGEDGRIYSIRIIDYAYCEDQIDWSKARKTKEEAEKINYMG